MFKIAQTVAAICALTSNGRLLWVLSFKGTLEGGRHELYAHCSRHFDRVFNTGYVWYSCWSWLVVSIRPGMIKLKVPASTGIGHDDTGRQGDVSDAWSVR